MVKTRNKTKTHQPFLCWLSQHRRVKDKEDNREREKVERKKKREKDKEEMR